MVVADSPISHPELPDDEVIPFDSMSGGRRQEDRIWQWEKAQELRSGKYTLWDHNFELPRKNLEASVGTVDSTTAGTITHKLRVGGNEELEIYEYPGGYAHRFDGIDPGGSERSSDLQKLFDDNQRTVKIRMQQVEAGTLAIHGLSDCRHMISGHKFRLDGHDDADGEYLLVSVHHEARLADIGRSGGEGVFRYQNQFTCIPAALPYRPVRKTPKPVIHGCQTAFVVGPSGEEIFTDKYGRVKVQFNWDREGRNDANSSCWLRVATPWAGKQWGMIHIPRIGNEVIVEFLEGDPDRPIITGMVYNPDSMPPYLLPDNKTQSGIKTRSSPKGESEHFNEIRFEDKKGAEEIYVHAERNKRVVVENNDWQTIGRHHAMRINGGRAVLITGDLGVDLQEAESLPDEDSGSGDLIGDGLIVEKNRYTYVGENELHEVQTGHRLHVLDGDQELTVTTGDQITTVEDGSQTVTIKQNQTIEIEQGNHTLKVKTGDSKTEIDQGNHQVQVKLGNRTIKVDLGKITEEAMQGIELKVGQNSVKIDQMGITIKGMMVKVEGQTMTEVKGLMTTVKGDAMLQAKGAITMIG
jgi:type VI secretion system secreted protein VgrG